MLGTSRPVGRKPPQRAAEEEGDEDPEDERGHGLDDPGRRHDDGPERAAPDGGEQAERYRGEARDSGSAGTTSRRLTGRK